jgi:Tfp pilus assembly protein PilN
VAAREANAIIDMRAFSWGDLFSQIEATLPENARVTGVQPRLDKDGRFLIGMRVEARQVEDMQKFLDALEQTGAFRNVLATDEQATNDGLIEAIVEGLYEPAAAQPPAEKPVAATRRSGVAGD